MAASYRHIARIAVLQALYALDYKKRDPVKTLSYVIKEMVEYKMDNEFAEKLLEKVLEKETEIEWYISLNAPDWPLDKIAPIDRNILKIGISEILYWKDVPPLVAINESIELAKEYGGENSSKFVNGVLSAIYEKNIKDSKKIAHD